MRCCAGDEGVALRRRPAGVASNRLMLRWLMTVVVSDEEKAHVMRQVGIGKASASEPLRKRRNNQDDIRTGEFKSLRDEPGGCPLVGQAVSGVKAARARSAATTRNVGCAGINRQEERDENARHRRSSDPRWPRVMRRRP